MIPSEAETDSNSFRMSDVQKNIWLWWKAVEYMLSRLFLIYRFQPSLDIVSGSRGPSDVLGTFSFFGVSILGSCDSFGIFGALCFFGFNVEVTFPVAF